MRLLTTLDPGLPINRRLLRLPEYDGIRLGGAGLALVMRRRLAFDPKRANSVGNNQNNSGGDDPPTLSRRSLALPIGTYLHSQWLRVHPASGSRGTMLPACSAPAWDRAVSQASGPGVIRTPRSKPSLCAFRKARSERAIWRMDFSIDPGRQQNIQVRTTANDVYSASRNKFSIWLKTARSNQTSFARKRG